MQASVVAVAVDTPPAAPAPGEAWIVGSAPTGDWAGEADALAGWTDGGWRFVVPTEGMMVWDRATGQPARWSAGSWTLGLATASRLVIAEKQVVGPQRPAIADPAGGGTIDAEARSVLTAVLTALRGHGLIAG